MSHKDAAQDFSAFAFRSLSLDHQLPSAMQIQPPRKSSPTTKRRLLKRQQSAVLPQAELLDGRVDLVSAVTTVTGGDNHYDVPRRPALTTCSSSYSKRQASFDSPTDLPLSPLLSLQLRNPFHRANTATPQSLKGKGVEPLSSLSIPQDYPEHATDDSSETSSTGFLSSPSAPTSPSLSHRTSNSNFTEARLKSKHMSSRSQDSPAARDIPDIPHASILPPQTQGSSPVFPFSRPYSLPDSHSNSYGAAALLLPPSTNPSWSDRTSCASLPLPMQTPYRTLPKIPSLEEGGEPSQAGDSDPPSASRAKPEAKVLDMLSPVSRPLPDQPLSPVAIRPTPSILSGSSSLSQATYPPPTPPTILAPSPPPVGLSETRTQAPYEPFLSHEPPPEDSWIVVETTQTEYRLIVRLPGFKRDGITLATRRRRILHIVADSWEPSGGHFERRISFGYDADLTQVRAEFDGEILKIVIPRRIPPVIAWYAPPAARS